MAPSYQLHHKNKRKYGPNFLTEVETPILVDLTDVGYICIKDIQMTTQVSRKKLCSSMLLHKKAYLRVLFLQLFLFFYMLMNDTTFI